MRIVDITGWFSSGAGGIKTYYRAKAQHLPPLGVDCHFVVPAAANDERPFGRGTLHGVAGPPVPGDASYRLMADLPRLRDLIRRLAPDVIELASHYVLPELVTWALGGRSVPLVGFYHADVPHAYVAPATRWLPRWAARRALDAAFAWVRHRHRRYQATLVASRTVEHALNARAVPGLRWVGLGVDLETFRPCAPRSARPTIVYAGRLNAEKAIATLLAAFARLRPGLGAELVVAGTGPLADQVAGQPGVRYLGYVEDRARLAALLASAWSVVVPGENETFSLIGAEALACGAPLVAPDRGAAAELARASEAGVTFRAADPRALAHALELVLRWPAAARDAAGRRGRAHIEAGHSWPAVCGRILDVYREVA